MTQIFLAVTLFRFLGFDLPSGSRAPFLATSFADFFRRWNHYVRDAVLRLFYFPALARARESLPARPATIVAAYVSILFGSFVMNHLLIPAASSTAPLSALGAELTVAVIVINLIYWTAIIMPRRMGLLPKPPKPPANATPFARRLFQARRVARFLLLYCALRYAAIELLGMSPI